MKRADLAQDFDDELDNAEVEVSVGEQSPSVQLTYERGLVQDRNG